jgi:hypothetical protein
MRKERQNYDPAETSRRTTEAIKRLVFVGVVLREEGLRCCEREGVARDSQTGTCAATDCRDVPEDMRAEGEESRTEDVSCC